MNNRLLIVDDSQVAREKLRAILSEGDYDIVEAADGADALRMVSLATPDVVLLDLDMPGSSGLEVLGQIRDNPETRNMGVIVMTIGQDSGEIVKAYEMGATDYIVKPFSKTFVLVRVRSVVRMCGHFKEKLLLMKEKHQLDKEFRASERHYEALLDNLADGVITTDGNGTIFHFSLAAQRMFGYRLSEVISKNFNMLISKSSRLHMKNERPSGNPAVSELAGKRQQFEGIRRSREQFPFELTVREMWDDEGLQYICTVRDLTEQMETEDILREARRIAEAANQSKSAFLANMSHELRTPLTAILGFAETLLASESDGVEAAQTIIRNGEHLLHLLNEILDLSKIEAGKMEISRIRCSPFAVVAEVQILLGPKAKAKGLLLEVENSTPVPETVFTDPLRLKQILVNLVGNAVKYTEAGGIRIALSFFERSEGPAVLGIDVIDTGIGMSAEQVASLFRPFVQPDTSAKRRFVGTGLGLTISKHFAEMLGGDITVQSVLDKGSTFFVRIEVGPCEEVAMVRQWPGAAAAEGANGRPLAPMLTAAATPITKTAASLCETTAATPKAEPSPKGGAATKKKKLLAKILLAEDGFDNRRLISLVLEKSGAEVEVAENGRIAYEKAIEAWKARQPFDVILMDMQMPVMDGYQSTVRLRQNGYPGPIIALTANAMEGDRDKCLEAGCNDYVAKPIKWAALMEVIERVIEAKR